MSHCHKVTLEGFGGHIFRGEIAAPYLKGQDLPENTLESSAWTSDGNADKVAAAVLAWAIDNGASVFCHWFQPLGAGGGIRHGQTAQVQIQMIEFTNKGRPIWGFKGSDLLSGETDGSSYPNGGLRSTHEAGGYLVVDPTSPIFLRGDSIFVPACFVSYKGEALDEKTPLLRSAEALSQEGTRLLGLLGYKANKVFSNIGLEQELFLVPRKAYLMRPDLQLTGRTIIGRMPPRGQEMSDHYMAPISLASPAMACMQEIQMECFKIGVPLRTRHREVAPNQYEFAPLYGTVTTQVDQNLVVMQMVEEVAAKHGLAALMHEKPFQGVNGSGKHNNWSIATEDGTNLLNVQQLQARCGSAEVFPVIMAAILKAINEYGDLMRMSIASPGNDFRLGACEAPPSIVSTCLGRSMTAFLVSYLNGEDKAYLPEKRLVHLGAGCLPLLQVPAEDRNRTSPFPYGGHRFEFRAVGSSQNVSMVNTVLNTIVAKAFKEFSEAIEAGQSPKQVAQQALRDAWKVIFNGNGYDLDEQDKLTAAGCWRYDNGIDATCRLSEPKNLALFEEMRVFTSTECLAREDVMLMQYVGTVEIEARCLIDMIQQHVIPSLRKAAALSCQPCLLASTATTTTGTTAPVETSVGASTKAFSEASLSSKSGKRPPHTPSTDTPHAHSFVPAPLSLCEAITQLQRDVAETQAALGVMEQTADPRQRAQLARALRLGGMLLTRDRVDAAEAVVPARMWTLATYKELLFMDQHVA